MIDTSHVEKVLTRLPWLESELSSPNAAANQRRFKDMVREHAALTKLAAKADVFFKLQREINEHRALLASAESDRELLQMAREELAQAEARLPQMEKDLLFALLPPSPDELRNAVVEIRAGTGGEEAALFAGDLFRMYSRYAESRRWKVAIVDASSSDLRGFKDIVFTVEGAEVYRWLQYESGGHRVQRVPVTEGSGRIHTSAATVAVFPEAEADDEIEIKPEEIRVDIFRSSGPGGQSVNTTDSAVRITHFPSGLVVQCQDEKSQHRNREKALNVLKARLLDIKRRAEAEKKSLQRRDLTGSGDRSQRIRTYNFPQNRLTDHRINLTLYNLDNIVDGELDDVIQPLRTHDLELRLAEEVKNTTG
ncbi:MAG: peptide chain release factor 1 [Verrucomicrobia bacterium]|nr:peptide chain release factor 1 [Verrucomicrobiota bacterium]